jgi:hypothetical protein
MIYLAEADSDSALTPEASRRSRSRALLSAGAHELGALAQRGVRYRYRTLPATRGGRLKIIAEIEGLRQQLIGAQPVP